MSDPAKLMLNLLETTCVRKSHCAFCGVPLWFVRNDRTRKLRAYDETGRDHFAATHVSPGPERKR